MRGMVTVEGYSMPPAAQPRACQNPRRKRHERPGKQGTWPARRTRARTISLWHGASTLPQAGLGQIWLHPSWKLLELFASIPVPRAKESWLSSATWGRSRRASWRHKPRPARRLRSPPLLRFVEERVVDSLALGVFPGLRSDPRLSVGSHHDARGEGGLAVFFVHQFVGVGIDLRERRRIGIRVVPLNRVILAVELAAAFPVLRFARGRHVVDREFYTALKRFPFGGAALRRRAGAELRLGYIHLPVSKQRLLRLSQ